MIASVLVLLIGLTDVVRTARSRTVAWLRTAAVWIGVAVVAVWGLDVPPLAVGACVALTLGWVICMPVDDTPSPRRLWPVAALVLLVAVTTVYDRTGERASGFLVDAYASASLDAVGGVTLRTAIAAVAVTVFLTTSGNLVVRAALGRSQRDEPPVDEPEPSGWEVRVRGRLVGTVGRPPNDDDASGRAAASGLPATSYRPATASRPADPPATSGRSGRPGRPGAGRRERGFAAEKRADPRSRLPGESDLRGGRLIGPIERLLITVLALGGAEAVIAALLAAKGIVRFPEISEDRRNGSKAEEFLIGSLASWAVSAAAVVFLHASRG